MENKINVRRLALDLLCESEKAGKYSPIALDNAIKKYRPDPADRSLLTALVMGVTEKRILLDYYINKMATVPPSKIETRVRGALRIGLYQLMFMDRIPSHAAVNESVSLVPRRNSGFVNALLRRYLREGEKIALPRRKDGVLRYLSVKYSFPEELCGRFCEIFGEEKAELVLAAFGDGGRLTLRVNTLKISRDELAEKISENGVEIENTPYSPDGLRLSSSASPRELYGFDDGAFFVQDEASQICVRALGAEKGMTVIDICSAPGSKSFGAAMTMEGKGKILAFDLHENKLSLIRDSAKRLGVDIIETAARDGRELDHDLEEIADRVICDVPCSGYGVMGKKPEIRYKPTAESAALPEIQYAILENACRYLKRGGSLIYSTCTLLPEENQLNVKRFLDSHPEFVSEPFSVGELNSPDGMLTLTPDSHGTDGFFVAKLKKV